MKTILPILSTLVFILAGCDSPASSGAPVAQKPTDSPATQQKAPASAGKQLFDPDLLTKEKRPAQGAPQTPPSNAGKQLFDPDLLLKKKGG